MVLTLVILSTIEFYHMAQHKGINVFFNMGIAGSVILTSCAFFKETNFIWLNKYFQLFTISIITIFILEFFLKKFILPSNPIVMTIRGLLYIALPFSFLFPSRNLLYGKYVLFFLAFGIILNDIFAFLIGRKWGKTKLSSLSPKKTLEGYFAGFLAGAVIIYFGLRGIGNTHAIILGIMTGLLAPLGDLFESFLKRSFNVKDAGSILPGHGGILDRIDSFILLIPLDYLYLFWIVKIKPL